MKKPNLANYQKAYQTFSWEKAEKEFKEKFKAIKSNKVALYWENSNGDKKKYTFKEFFLLSNKFANVLRERGVKKGNRVFFFLPRIPAVYFGLLGTLKIGAVGGTLFPAFGTQALYDRLKNSGTEVLVTNRELYQRVKKIKKSLPKLKKILFADQLPKLLDQASEKLETVKTKPTDPALMLYTSATGNTPVCGIVIPHKALVQQYFTAKWILDLHKNDVYWCTADPGWVTGVVYGILAPWMLGVSQVVFEGRFSAEKWYSLLEKYKINVLYTAPTALRMLQIEEEAASKFDFSSLRHICSVGEALPPDSISWTQKIFALPVYDTWWQTETGAMMIANYRCLKIKPGSMGKPVPGIKAVIVNNKGKILPANKEGNLAFKPGWPSMMIDVWKNKKRYQSYFAHHWYLSGDRAYQDKDGYFWFIGRADDVIKTSGERVGPFEVESVLVSHPAITEACVIGKPDKLRGQIIKAFLVLKANKKGSEEFKEEIKAFVKKQLAGHAYPREIEFVASLPRNPSGKVVRRLLKAK
ncbi:acetate--CoA ligase [Candidatus Shapirobacteria bacterium CG10_big_fil_rev_8_21_14_0_10_38_14]|uniref:Acetate--CoA ligase n=1 Tax=Candidatus Shapirobacteria bacterium CG10_big_fil_rev_8_21_14_0_10_38_14 TaxID=1974483 RepID=A0A2M8L520_9BACT|nr:MAG: acetate--CoA ligase [Candidatus Shapirobacteria bacterium CG10_big_fil_rev_8_21_14_0_10_38_14]